MGCSLMLHSIASHRIRFGERFDSDSFAEYFVTNGFQLSAFGFRPSSSTANLQRQGPGIAFSQ